MIKIGTLPNGIIFTNYLLDEFDLKDFVYKTKAVIDGISFIIIKPTLFSMSQFIISLCMFLLVMMYKEKQMKYSNSNI